VPTQNAILSGYDFTIPGVAWTSIQTSRPSGIPSGETLMRLTVILDCSSSMQKGKTNRVNLALSAIYNSPKVGVLTVIQFGTSAMVPVTFKKKQSHVLTSFKANCGGTNFIPALQRVETHLRSRQHWFDGNACGDNVVLFCDGATGNKASFMSNNLGLVLRELSCPLLSEAITTHVSPNVMVSLSQLHSHDALFLRVQILDMTIDEHPTTTKDQHSCDWTANEAVPAPRLLALSSRRRWAKPQPYHNPEVDSQIVHWVKGWGAIRRTIPPAALLGPTQLWDEQEGVKVPPAIDLALADVWDLARLPSTLVAMKSSAIRLLFPGWTVCSRVPEVIPVRWFRSGCKMSLKFEQHDVLLRDVHGLSLHDAQVLCKGMARTDMEQADPKFEHDSKISLVAR